MIDDQVKGEKSIDGSPDHFQVRQSFLGCYGGVIYEIITYLLQVD